MNAAKQASSKKSSIPHIIEGALKNIETIAEKRNITVSTQALISAITNAHISHKYALQLELATGLILFTEANGADRDSKQALQQCYVQAGYDTQDKYGSEYKTVRRRIDVAAELYNWLGHIVIEEWMEGKVEMASIMSVVQNLEQYELRSVNSVLALVGKPVIQRPRLPKEDKPKKEPEEKISVKEFQARQKGSPEENRQEESQQEEHSEVAKMVAKEVEEGRGRRASDVEGSVIIGTNHLRVAIPPDASKSELISLAMQLLQFAEEVAVSEEHAV